MLDETDPRPQRNLSTPFWIVVLIIVAMGAYGLGVRAERTNIAANGLQTTTTAPIVKVRGIGSQPPADLVETIDFKQFWELWDILNTRFYKQPLDEETLLYGAMAGLTRAAGDPYTVFFEPAIAKEFSQALDGKFEGIGAEIGIKNEQLMIIAPLANTPAARSGLLSGDAILMIGATSTEGMSTDEAVSLIRGKKGTTVVLSIGRIKITKGDDGKEKREASQMEVAIVRDTIVVPSVNTELLDDNIAVIEITHFNSDTTKEFSKAVDQALAKDTKGVILDLRNNPGGYLDRATAVAGEWVGDDLVVIERRRGEKFDEYHGTGKGRLKDMPTVVLVNEGSASASEIVAGALQDYEIATLVGKKTFGKGSVQDYSELVNGTAVKITVAEWLTPKERFINEIGIDPDIFVDMTEEDYAEERDPQLDKAVEILTGKASTSTLP
ncbi:MAG: S41 family peptidase [Patescibacteria group bacterium]|nr:S41 family peptidase [Patescibacteria group bacterium]MBU2509533.1 S41 family peptidase [Patescibacteria group bacterium]